MMSQRLCHGLGPLVSQLVAAHLETHETGVGGEGCAELLRLRACDAFVLELQVPRHAVDPVHDVAIFLTVAGAVLPGRGGVGARMRGASRGSQSAWPPRWRPPGGACLRSSLFIRHLPSLHSPGSHAASASTRRGRWCEDTELAKESLGGASRGRGYHMAALPLLIQPAHCRCWEFFLVPSKGFSITSQGHIAAPSFSRGTYFRQHRRARGAAQDKIAPIPGATAIFEGITVSFDEILIAIVTALRIIHVPHSIPGGRLEGIQAPRRANRWLRCDGGGH